MGISEVEFNKENRVLGLVNKLVDATIDDLSKDDIEAVVGEKVANSIENARTGNAKAQSGGGGNYGKII